MYCPSCGYEISEGDDYCWHCGHEFGADESEERTDERTTRKGATRKPQNDDVLAPLVHVLALFLWIFAPLIVYLLTENEFVKRNAVNALNWQISYAVYMLVSVFLVLFVVGIFTAVLVGFADLILCVVAAVKAADGEAWKYPMTIDIV